MRKLIALLVFVLASVSVSAQYKKDGTPDMRYKVNKQIYGNTYTPSYSSHSSYSYPKTKARTYNYGGVPRLQNGNNNIGLGGSTQWLTDASYLSLKNVNLGYSISDKILETLYMKSNLVSGYG